jgi:hypothetical protein
VEQGTAEVYYQQCIANSQVRAAIETYKDGIMRRLIYRMYATDQLTLIAAIKLLEYLDKKER